MGSNGTDSRAREGTGLGTRAGLPVASEATHAVPDELSSIPDYTGKGRTKARPTKDPGLRSPDGRHEKEIKTCSRPLRGYNPSAAITAPHHCHSCSPDSSEQPSPEQLPPSIVTTAASSRTSGLGIHLTASVQTAVWKRTPRPAALSPQASRDAVGGLATSGTIDKCMQARDHDGCTQESPSRGMTSRRHANGDKNRNPHPSTSISP